MGREVAIDPASSPSQTLLPFAPGGALEGFPGALVLVGSDGIVLGANGAAKPIVGLFRSEQVPEELRLAVAAALGGRAAQVNPLLIPPPPDTRGAELAFDVAVLPWGGKAGDTAAALLLGRDITLERSLRSALIESRQRFKDLVEAISDFAWETDGEGRFAFISAHGALGYGAGELVGTRAEDLQVDRIAGEESPFVTRQRLSDVELWVRRAGGETVCLLTTALPLFGADGTWRGARGVCRDITTERSQRAKLAVDRHRERLLGYILSILRDEMNPARMLQAACGALVPALPAAGAGLYRR
ncbi:MAG: PAS domain S-box protein, partial [Alphaproteobacteria bacterium]